MKKQGKTLLVFLFLNFLFPYSGALHTQEIHSIQQNIFLAKPGDYAVFSRGTQRIFVLVKSSSINSVWLEIIDFPSLLCSERNFLQETSWKSAIHHLKSPATVIVIFLSKEQLKAFSLCPKTKKLYPISNAQNIPLLIKIFKIPLTPAPKHLIKMGKDHNPWSPKVTLEESSTASATTEALLGSWPKDLSILSEADILMYFTHPTISVFPLWASINTPKGPTVLRALSVGHEATSPYEYSLPEIDA
ncbi:hypothetical protein [Chlamydia sp. 17-3921]|uniref:hypothetical protein n=1 Tax=Chlamydia sp. 17-3921 TaxID=2675798 RepID=UPI00191916DC|nr:hypothetical protein [Chlamydia sp. 17-3921]